MYDLNAQNFCVYLTLSLIRNHVEWSKLLKAAYADSRSNNICLICDSVSSSDACMEFKVVSQLFTFSFPSKSDGISERRFIVSTKSRKSGCSSSIALISSRSLSISVINKDTISAIHLLVFPLSSLIVIGRSSLILASAAGQSNLYFLTKASTVGKKL